jgi:hypothetical protein
MSQRQNLEKANKLVYGRGTFHDVPLTAEKRSSVSERKIRRWRARGGLEIPTFWFVAR